MKTKTVVCNVCGMEIIVERCEDIPLTCNMCGSELLEIEGYVLGSGIHMSEI